MLELIQDNEKKIIARLVQLDADAFGRGGLSEWHLVPMIRHGRVFVWKEDEVIVGSVQYILDWDHPRKAYMFGVSVAKGWRGRGVGAALLKESFRALYREKMEDVELTVDPENTAALKLYRDKLGFVDTEYLANEYGEGENRLVMKLSLSIFVDGQSADV
jgi:ribosomal-protein-alanine N-acetyltransferase